MLKFDHLTILVSDWIASRDWYVKVLGLKVEFEIAERRTVAVQDEHAFTIFLVQDTYHRIPQVFRGFSKSMMCGISL